MDNYYDTISTVYSTINIRNNIICGLVCWEYISNVSPCIM